MNPLLVVGANIIPHRGTYLLFALLGAISTATRGRQSLLHPDHRHRGQQGRAGGQRRIGYLRSRFDNMRTELPPAVSGHPVGCVTQLT
jgi:hypothetical protein